MADRNGVAERVHGRKVTRPLTTIGGGARVRALHLHRRVEVSVRILSLPVLLAIVTLAGCATANRMATKMGWRGEHAVATDTVRANCAAATRTLAGGPDHDTALRACIDAKTRQHVD